jgi:hypothetical protein
MCCYSMFENFELFMRPAVTKAFSQVVDKWTRLELISSPPPPMAVCHNHSIRVTSCFLPCLPLSQPIEHFPWCRLRAALRSHCLLFVIYLMNHARNVKPGLMTDLKPYEKNKGFDRTVLSVNLNAFKPTFASSTQKKKHNS